MTLPSEKLRRGSVDPTDTLKYITTDSNQIVKTVLKVSVFAISTFVLVAAIGVASSAAFIPLSLLHFKITLGIVAPIILARFFLAIINFIKIKYYQYTAEKITIEIPETPELYDEDTKNAILESLEKNLNINYFKIGEFSKDDGSERTLEYFEREYNKDNPRTPISYLIKNGNN